MKAARAPSRRRLLQTLAGGFAGSALAGGGRAAEAAAASLPGSFALDGERVQLRSPAVQQPLRLVLIADTHLSLDDARGEPFRSFSGRMAGAYRQTRHFKTGAPTTAEASFVEALQQAKKQHADLVALVGDILSFPSEAAVEWVLAQLRDCGRPWLYIAGNHDWHYEGLAGSSAELRAVWTEKRLRPLYQNQPPLMSSRDLGGVRVVAIDNSTYTILPEQLEFFRREAAGGRPMILLVHIPLYAPGRPVGFGCGHPQWGAAADRHFEIERRPRWPESGPDETTLAFHREVFAAPNLLGVFAGHAHRASLDVVGGVPQFVTAANALGAWLDLEILPPTAA